MDLQSKIALFWRFICIFCVAFLLGGTVFSQKIDTSKISIKPKAKVVSKVPQIKANIQPYRNPLGYTPSNSIPTSSTKSAKILTILKVYPNPINDQVNISFRLDREIMFSVKITDLLGNDVIRLANERAPAGEQTKTYAIPNKLNPGMYFLKIEAGGEPKVMRISVL